MAINILVVDRNGRVQDMLKECLTPLECQIITASSTALAVFLARKNFPSLVVLNLDSEDDDHRDLPHEIASDVELAHIPVVVLVPSTNGQLQHLAAKLGATKVLTRPAEAEALRNLLVPFLIEKHDDRVKETTE